MKTALKETAAALGVIRAQSALYQTPAFPVGSGPDFVNAAVAIDTLLQPEGVLAELHEIERRGGRQRYARWEPRTMDLDLIALDDMIRPDVDTYNRWKCLPVDQQQTLAPETLVLPHPRMHERAFVLVPLLDVAPDWVHPVSGKNVAHMVDDLPVREKEAVRRL